MTVLSVATYIASTLLMMDSAACLTSAEFDTDAVELCMAHHLKDDYNGAYNRTTLEEERREVMEAWGDYCLSQASNLL